MNDFIELRRILTVLKSRLRLVILATVLGAGAGLIISRNQTPVYEATTTLLVGQFMQTTTVSRVDIQTSVDAAKTYADIALRQPVLDRVVTSLGLDQTWQDLKKQVRVKALEGTQLIEVTAEALTPETARAIADQVAAQLITISPTTLEQTSDASNYDFLRRQLDSLKAKLSDAQNRMDEIEVAIAASTSETETAQLEEEKATLEQSIINWEKNYASLSDLARQERATNNYLTIIEPAQSTESPVRPRTTLDVIVGGGMGFVLVLGLVFLLEYLNDTYRTSDELQHGQELTVLGTVGSISGTQISDKVIAYQKPFSPITESYRMIRNKIQFRPGDQRALRSILVTSPSSGDGKSVTAVNLAVIMAKAGHKIILVDADMSQPSLHEMFNVEKHMGLADMLDPLEVEFDPYIKRTSIRTLSLVTSGTPIPDASERISTERMSEVIHELEQKADIVIFDSPPALLAADAAILASHVDGVVLVVRAGKTKRSDARRAILDLENVEANMLGCVLNEAAGSHTYNDYRNQR